MTDPASAARMAEVAAALGEIAVLVNNAGGVTSPSLQSTGVEQWRRDLALNLEGAFNCFRAVEGQLKATRGAVVNIASVNAHWASSAILATAPPRRASCSSPA